jgi:hypothetical protein
MTQTWTRDTPTQGGYYWFKHKDYPDSLDIIEVRGSSVWNSYYGYYQESNISEFDGEFAGPIPEPEA